MSGTLLFSLTFPNGFLFPRKVPVEEQGEKTSVAPLTARAARADYARDTGC